MGEKIQYVTKTKLLSVTLNKKIIPTYNILFSSEFNPYLRTDCLSHWSQLYIFDYILTLLIITLNIEKNNITMIMDLIKRKTIYDS